MEAKRKKAVVRICRFSFLPLNTVLQVMFEEPGMVAAAKALWQGWVGFRADVILFADGTRLSMAGETPGGGQELLQVSVRPINCAVPLQKLKGFTLPVGVANTGDSRKELLLAGPELRAMCWETGVVRVPLPDGAMMDSPITVRCFVGDGAFTRALEGTGKADGLAPLPGTRASKRSGALRDDTRDSVLALCNTSNNKVAIKRAFAERDRALRALERLKKKQLRLDEAAEAARVELVAAKAAAAQTTSALRERIGELDAENLRRGGRSAGAPGEGLGGGAAAAPRFSYGGGGSNVDSGRDKRAQKFESAATDARAKDKEALRVLSRAEKAHADVDKRVKEGVVACIRAVEALSRANAEAHPSVAARPVTPYGLPVINGPLHACFRMGYALLVSVLELCLLKKTMGRIVAHWNACLKCGSLAAKLKASRLLVTGKASSPVIIFDVLDARPEAQNDDWVRCQNPDCQGILGDDQIGIWSQLLSRWKALMKAMLLPQPDPKAYQLTLRTFHALAATVNAATKVIGGRVPPTALTVEHEQSSVMWFAAAFGAQGCVFDETGVEQLFIEMKQVFMRVRSRASCPTTPPLAPYPLVINLTTHAPTAVLPSHSFTHPLKTPPACPPARPPPHPSTHPLSSHSLCSGKQEGPSSNRFKSKRPIWSVRL
jgi:hypothetical protein